MDQIFDRLDMLVRAWMSSTFGEGFGRTRFRDSEMFEDQDLADAWDELESYLDPFKADKKHKTRTNWKSYSYRYYDTGETLEEETKRKAVEEAYIFLGLEPYAPFAQVKMRYKKLLKEHHPDRHNKSDSDTAEANAISAKINAAYQLIETWEESQAKSSK
ncbi:MAG TPA: J domain-containing protein [Rectinema sp.]|nr:J domain-containing protein [Spirochaetia bacterium]HNT59875.1 J domain-containing protein [Rectinema sp.]HOO02118.1 J domain-containing protein [Rectinema sp.]HOR91212.1 J domain-containing protein [Rectinema sp.]HPD69614.1 J domain-containing protein [Rectinema sp.]